MKMISTMTFVTMLAMSVGLSGVAVAAPHDQPAPAHQAQKARGPVAAKAKKCHVEMEKVRRHGHWVTEKKTVCMETQKTRR